MGSAFGVKSTALLAVVTACGRIGYDPVETPDDVYSSCTEVRDTRADAVDGVYLIEAGVDGAPIPAYCDLTGDGGGWMLVTRDMIVDERSLSVTVVDTQDDRGGLVRRVYANTRGCVDPDNNVHLVAFSDRPAWTQIRARFKFAGATSCWWIFGEVSPELSKVDGEVIAPKLVPFESGVDTIREQVRMGGVVGDAFDGTSTRCDNETTNFWHEDRGLDERGAVVILHRDAAQPGAAGLATTTTCTEFGPGTSSPTWWEYSDISVR